MRFRYSTTDFPPKTSLIVFHGCRSFFAPRGVQLKFLVWLTAAQPSTLCPMNWVYSLGLTGTTAEPSFNWQEI